MKSEHTELRSRLEAYSPDDPAAAFPFSARLARDHAWPRDYARRVIREYQRFAFLAVAAGHPVTPSDAVDQAWHLHLVYTESYWKDFCGQVLRTPLHHQPTKGGPRERDKFNDWYGRTLESYRRFFGEAAPADIWPDPERRFGDTYHFVRINTKRHWVVPKLMCIAAFERWTAGALANARSAISDWRLRGQSLLTSAITNVRRKKGLVAVQFAVLLFATGCGVTMAGIASPFNLSGSSLLQVYLAAWAAGLGLAAWLRWHLRTPADKPKEPMPELDPYAIAYLSGAGERAVHAAIVSLVKHGALTMSLTEKRLLSVARPAPDAPAFELGIWAKFSASSKSATIAESCAAARMRLPRFEEPLQALGLVVTETQARKALWLPFLIALLVPAAGAIKIAFGDSEGMTEGWPTSLCIFSMLVALLGFAHRPRLTRRGDQVLAELKRRYAALANAPEMISKSPAVATLPLAVGLFGLGVLAHTSLADLEKLLQPPRDSGGAGGDSGCGGCGADD